MEQQKNLHASIPDALLARVLREKFEWSGQLLSETEEDIRSYTSHVTPTQVLNVIKADPSDNRILECSPPPRL